MHKLESGRFIAFYAFFEPFFSGEASRPASLSWYRGKPLKENRGESLFHADWDSKHAKHGGHE